MPEGCRNIQSKHRPSVTMSTPQFIWRKYFCHDHYASSADKAGWDFDWMPIRLCHYSTDTYQTTGSDTSLLGTDKAKATLTSVFDEAGHAWLDTDEAKVAPLYQQFIPFTTTWPWTVLTVFRHHESTRSTHKFFLRHIVHMDDEQVFYLTTTTKSQFNRRFFVDYRSRPAYRPRESVDYAISI